MANSRVILALHVAACILLADVARAQSQNATTDPSEVAILNSIWSTWRLTSQAPTWNISGESCSGAAIDASVSFDDYNPLIICDCSFSNSTTCHITQLRVYALSVAGPIPDELWNLTYLFNLNLAQNLLTGFLSPSIGHLTRMQYLSLGINALSGELPLQLGQLTELLSLSFSTNNFSGSLPSELGNLSKLQQLYMDSSGVSGEIPSTFSNLKNLQIVWASDNNFTGNVPEFIGNWAQLIQLLGEAFSNNRIGRVTRAQETGRTVISALRKLRRTVVSLSIQIGST